MVIARLKSQLMLSPNCSDGLAKIVSALFPAQQEEDYGIEENVEKDIPPTTEVELLTATSKVGKNKAPGVDGIQNVALKTAIEAAQAMFLHMYNTCLREGTLSDNCQRLVLLPKRRRTIILSSTLHA